MRFNRLHEAWSAIISSDHAMIPNNLYQPAIETGIDIDQV